MAPVIGSNNTKAAIPGSRHQLDQDLLAAVAGRGDRVGCQRAEGNGIRQSLRPQLLGEQRLTKKDPLEHLSEGHRYRTPAIRCRHSESDTHVERCQPGNKLRGR